MLGGCWIGFAIAYRGTAWLLIWPGVSYLLAGAAYGGAGVRVFGKRADGTVSCAHLIVLFPYIGLAWCVWALGRVMSTEPAANEIAPSLWIGRRPTVGELPENVGLIVDLTCELWEPATVRRAFQYICVPTLDGSFPIADQAREVVEKLRSLEGVALIHCAQGHGRSAALAAAVLVARGVASDLDEALRRIKAARPGVRVGPNQRQAVMRLTATALLSQPAGVTPPPG